MSNTLDLSECFNWVSSYELKFSKEPDCVETRILSLRSLDKEKQTRLYIARRDNQYKLAELKSYEETPEGEPLYYDFRHARLFLQEHRLPHYFPISNDQLLGPMNCVNMVRVLQMVQAKLSGHEEMLDNTRSNLCDYYAEQQARRQAGIIPFERKWA